MTATPNPVLLDRMTGRGSSWEHQVSAMETVTGLHDS